MSRRTMAAILAVTVVLNVTALAWIAWIVADPSYWFPGAYAERGEQGPPGPRGPRGLVGPPGPVGPDAEDAIDVLSSDLEEVTGRVDDLESAAGTSELQAQVDELTSTVENICSELSLSDVEPLNDIYVAAC